jgi:hypothetical protein
VRVFKPGGGIEALEGVTPEVIAEVCGCHISTARRWKRGEMPPLSALKIIRLYTSGELGEIDLKWRGWRLRDGQLVAPHGEQFGTGDVMSITFLRQLVASYQVDQRYERQADWISERWEPALPVEAAS